MSRQACKRLRRHLKLEVNRDPLPAFAWPGGYPMFYVFADGGAVCPACVNRNVSEIDEDVRRGGRRNSHGGWAVDAWEVNWEEPDMHCDHCGKRIPSAYAEDKVKS